jgi:hypothetical protein
MLDIGLKQSMLAKDQDSFFKYAKAIQDAKKDPTKYFRGLTEAIDPVTQKPILLAMTETGAVPSGYAPKAKDAKEPKTSLVKTSNGFEVVRDGELPKGTPPVDMPAPEKPITGYQKIKLEGELRDDYRNDSKTYLEIARQAKIIQNSLNDKSAAGTLASATAFMKMLDPGSVVRESELAMAMKTNGALDRMGNYINVILSGKVLTEQQKVDFAKLVKSYSEAANEAHAKTNERYWKIASEYKLDPKRVVLYDIEKEKPATVKANINHGDTINELPTSAPKGSVAKNPTTGQPEYIFNGIKWIPYGSNK